MTFYLSGMRCRQQGLSLIELMISIALGLLLMVAIFQVFHSNQNLYRMQDSVSRMQESGRFSLEFMADDIRMAGFIGCSLIDRTGIDDPRGLAADFATGSIISGVSNVGANITRGTVKVVPGSDTLIVRSARAPGEKLTNSAASGATTMSLAANTPGLAQGNTAVISDCLHAELFSVAGFAAGELTASAALINSYGGDGDGEVFRYQQTEYFVGETGRTTPGGKKIHALYVNRGNGPEEFVPGVETMRIEFGEDTGTDRAADRYQSASAISNWDDVVSVRLNLLLHGSTDNVATGAQQQSLSFMGQAVTADGRLRQVFSSTVAIRNRVP